MSFVRPDLVDAARRWRDVLVGAGVAALGALTAVSTGGVLFWLGVCAILVGGLLVLSGVQRGRFRRASGGPGLVQVDERQVTYFGPLSGGIVPLGNLTRVELDPRGTPLHWVLHHRSGDPVHIPLNAEGAEALFDVFASLPGLRTEAMLALMDDPPDVPVTVWRVDRPARIDTRRN